MINIENNSDSFGSYLKTLITDSSLTQLAFYKRLNISKTYFVQIINNQIKPPTPEKQFEIVQILNLNNEAAYMLFDKAAKARSELPADIQRYIQNNNEIIHILRKSNKEGLIINLGGHKIG